MLYIVYVLFMYYTYNIIHIIHKVIGKVYAEFRYLLDFGISENI